MRSISISPFEEKHIRAVKDFTDRWVGVDYFSPPELNQLLKSSIAPVSELGGRLASASCLAWGDQDLLGLLISLAPGQWDTDSMPTLKPHWPNKADKVGYLKSIFVHGSFHHQGIGRRLAQISLSILKQQGAQGIVAHSWIESPENSSQLFLKNLGFVEIGRHSQFWSDKPYSCVRCSPRDCECTAAEMFKIFEA